MMTLNFERLDEVLDTSWCISFPVLVTIDGDKITHRQPTRWTCRPKVFIHSYCKRRREREPDESTQIWHV